MLDLDKPFSSLTHLKPLSSALTSALGQLSGGLIFGSVGTLQKLPSWFQRNIFLGKLDTCDSHLVAILGCVNVVGDGVLLGR